MSVIVKSYKNKILNNINTEFRNSIELFKSKMNLIYVVKKDYSFFSSTIEFLKQNLYFLEVITVDQKKEKENLEIRLNKDCENVFVLTFEMNFTILEYLKNNYECNVIDLFRKNTFEIGFLCQEERKKLWNNIARIEENLSSQKVQIIIDSNLNTYKDIFYLCLDMSGLINEQTLGVLYNSHFYKDTFGDTLENISNSIIFSDTESDLIYKNYFYGINYCYLYEFINYFLLTTSYKLPQNSKVISMKHSIVDDPNPFFNDIFIHSKYNLKKADKVITSSSIHKQGISLGYPKLDKFISTYKELKKETNNIIFITSSFAGVFKKINPLILNDNFIKETLEIFPSNQIFFRPHPNIKKHKKVLEIVEELNVHKNFNYDDNPSYLKTFSESKVFISDGLGSSSYTYSFATLKPVIFYIPKYKQYMEYFKDNFFTKNMKIIGEIASSKDELFWLISKYLTDKDYYLKKVSQIKHLRDNNINNIGNSSLFISQYIKNYILMDSRKEKLRLREFYENKFKEISKKNINIFFDNLEGKNICIYGASDHYEKVFQKLYDFQKLNIKCFSDSNKDILGKKIYDLPILSNDELFDFDVILISSYEYEKEIYEQLKSKYSNVIQFYESQYYNYLFAIDYDLEYSSQHKIRYDMIWQNIKKIELFLNEEEVQELINKNFKSYEELFTFGLKIIEKEDVTFLEKEDELFYLDEYYYSYK